jgi:uncharacterized secreted protein with C-terminal beta-propeller domain
MLLLLLWFATAAAMLPPKARVTLNNCKIDAVLVQTRLYVVVRTSQANSPLLCVKIVSVYEPKIS